MYCFKLFLINLEPTNFHSGKKLNLEVILKLLGLWILMGWSSVIRARTLTSLIELSPMKINLCPDSRTDTPDLSIFNLNFVWRGEFPSSVVREAWVCHSAIAKSGNFDTDSGSSCHVTSTWPECESSVNLLSNRIGPLMAVSTNFRPFTFYQILPFPSVTTPIK